MNWNRAKNIILTAFVLLNIGLFVLLFIEDRRYTVSIDMVDNIHTVLSRNNITIYANLPRRFSPMQSIETAGIQYDNDVLVNKFFSEPDRVEFYIDDIGAEVFFFENERLEIFNGFVSFDLFIENPSEEAVDRDFAVRITSDFVNRHLSGFELDIVLDDIRDGQLVGLRLFYLQVYRGERIHSNFIEFWVTADGIVRIDMEYAEVLGKRGAPQMIFSPGEILLTFMHRFRYIAATNPIFINRIDLVYLKEYNSVDADAVIPAVPFYRIFINGRDVPTFINAYTNRML